VSKATNLKKKEFGFFMDRPRTLRTLFHVALHTLWGTEWQLNFKTYVDRAPVTDHHIFTNLPLNQYVSIDKFTYLCHPQITDISKKFWSSHSYCTSVL